VTAVNSGPQRARAAARGGRRGRSPREPDTVQLFEADDAGSAIGHVLVYQDPRLFALFEKNPAVDR
jgi:hypothetical protein